MERSSNSATSLHGNGLLSCVVASPERPDIGPSGPLMFQLASPSWLWPVDIWV